MVLKTILISELANILLMTWIILRRRKEALSADDIVIMFLLGILYMLPAAFLESMLIGSLSGKPLRFDQALLIGVIEELFKGFIAVFFIVRRRNTSRSGFYKIDALMCGIAPALGVACVENVYYSSQYGDLMTGFFRIFSGLGHATYCIIIAAFFFSALESADKGKMFKALIQGFSGFAIASALHGIWNSAYLTYSTIGSYYFRQDQGIVSADIGYLPTVLWNAFGIAIPLLGVFYTLLQYKKGRQLDARRQQQTRDWYIQQMDAMRRRATEDRYLQQLNALRLHDAEVRYRQQLDAWYWQQLNAWRQANTWQQMDAWLWQQAEARYRQQLNAWYWQQMNAWYRQQTDIWGQQQINVDVRNQRQADTQWRQQTNTSREQADAWRRRQIDAWYQQQSDTLMYPKKDAQYRQQPKKVRNRIS